MKTDKLTLMKWRSRPDYDMDINWPAVHKMVGEDKIRWITDQLPQDCIMILEKAGLEARLVVEFYNKKVLTAYYLMWA
jgi:hypothetical protein